MTENASPGQQPSFGMAMRFNVVVDGISLGNWASCKGLEFTCEPVKFHEHGNYDYETILFVKVKYAVVKLERAIDKVASGQLRQWLSSELNSQPGTQLLGIGGKTATITLLDAAWNPVTSWTLRNVFPAGWQGPTLSAKETAVATERLELLHEGFL
jgi:phage tail-like protein